MKKFKPFFIPVLLLLYAVGAFLDVHAEGSRELNSSLLPNSYRVFLHYENEIPGTGTAHGNSSWFKITALDSLIKKSRLFVFANAGEDILLASSALGIGNGSIIVTAPDGITVRTYNSTSSPIYTGSIQPGTGSKARENEGPFGYYNGGVGGYTPIVHRVSVTGIYVIAFTSPDPSSGNGQYNPGNPPATNADFAQPSNMLIASFDVSVRNSHGLIITGRLFSDYLSMSTGKLNTGIMKTNYTQNYTLQALTREGTRYEIFFHELAPYGYFIAADNVGLQLSDGVTPSYESTNLEANGNRRSNRRIFNPFLEAESANETKHKLFFNQPDNSMPASSTALSKTVWLYSTFTPTSYNPNLSYNVHGNTSPLEGNFSFNFKNPGVRYKISVDVNGDNVYGNGIDIMLAGTSVSGLNALSWNGLDANGNPVPYTCYKVNIQFFAGELHLPLADAEITRKGIQIKRLNGLNPAPASTLFWNDLTLNRKTEITTGSYSSKTIPGNVSSLNSVHHREKPESSSSNIPTQNLIHDNNHGNERLIDQWTYDTISSTTYDPLFCRYALPLKLNSFNTTALNNQVKVIWEINDFQNCEFDVEKSIKGKAFVKIGTLKSIKRSNTYHYSDHFITNDETYYRLRINVPDKTYFYSKVIALNKPNVNNGVVVAPNPAKGLITFTIQNKTITTRIQIVMLDQKGRVVKSISTNNGTPLNISDLMPGNYSYQIFENKSKISNGKIAVTKSTDTSFIIEDSTHGIYTRKSQ